MWNSKGSKEEEENSPITRQMCIKQVVKQVETNKKKIDSSFLIHAP